MTADSFSWSLSNSFFRKEKILQGVHSKPRTYQSNTHNLFLSNNVLKELFLILEQVNKLNIKAYSKETTCDFFVQLSFFRNILNTSCVIQTTTSYMELTSPGCGRQLRPSSLQSWWTWHPDKGFHDPSGTSWPEAHDELPVGRGEISRWQVLEFFFFNMA